MTVNRLKKILIFTLIFSWLTTGWPGSWLTSVKPAQAQVASGIIVAWPSTNASIPSGWSRVTALDSKYTRGIPDSSTNPGTTGGSANHSHASSAHNHSISHTHSTSGNSSGPTGTANVATTGTPDAADTAHTHTTGTISATTDNSGDNSTSSDNTANDPANLSVIWIQSNGTPAGIPNGALAFFNSASLPTNWAIYTNSQNRFPKGAAGAGDGGGTNGAATHNHTGQGSHSHTSSHVHPDGTSSNGANINNSQASGTLAAEDVHNHSYSVSSNNFGTSNTQTLTTSTDNHEPPFQKVAVIENQTGGNDMPIGTIAVWRGTLANIPEGWVLADGNNGTPNLLGDFVKGALNTGEIGNTGGATSHSHTGSNHTHTWTSTAHTHSVDINGASSSTVGVAGATGRASSTHTHTATSGAAGTVTVGNAAPNMNSATHLPSYEEVAYIMWQGVTSPVLTQNDWRIYVDDNTLALTSDDPWPSGATNLGENESLVSVPPGNDPIDPTDHIRIRMSIAVSDAALSSGSEGFILQYKEAQDCTDGTSWTDVDAISGSGTWRFYDAAGVTNGDTLSGLKLSAADVAGRYSESDPTSTNPNTVTAGQDLEWDWHVEYNGPEEAHTYCFRMRKDDPADLDAYNSDSYPKVDTRPGTNDLMRHGSFFTSGAERGFFWAD